MRCHACLGNKLVMGLGWMEASCRACGGTGVAMPTAKPYESEATGSVLRVDEATCSVSVGSGTAEPLEGAAVQNVARGTKREERRAARRG